MRRSSNGSCRACARFLGWYVVFPVGVTLIDCSHVYAPRNCWFAEQLTHASTHPLLERWQQTLNVLLGVRLLLCMGLPWYRWLDCYCLWLQATGCWAGEALAP